MNDLIDTTEMYLRTVLELEEENVTPLRARIAERLHQSGPTVSQTVARMERDGLVIVEGDRHLQLTPKGRARAISVMRKHRLAELLLVNVIGLEYEIAHIEACRWEHVMSDEVERKVYQLLGRPKVSPYGNRIPGLAELDNGLSKEKSETTDYFAPLAHIASGSEVSVQRISEQLQNDPEIMHELHQAGIEPGSTVTVRRVDGEVLLEANHTTAKLNNTAANLIFVTEAELPAAV